MYFDLCSGFILTPGLKSASTSNSVMLQFHHKNLLSFILLL